MVLVLLGAIKMSYGDFSGGLPGKLASGMYAAEVQAKEQVSAGEITKIQIGDRVLQRGVQRMGMNLADQTFYGSGQMMKNLVGRNAGFEGMEWQSILHCHEADAGHCTDGMQNAVWGDGFWQGGTYEVISGAAEGRTGRVVASRKADAGRQGEGVSVVLEGNPPLRAGDYLIVRKSFPGNAEAGWWVENGGGRLGTEFKDLSPRTPGRQALRVDAVGAGQSMALVSYFDSTTDRSFLRINGRYRLKFRAKWLSGNPVLHVSFERGTNPATQFYRNDVALKNSWQDYSFDFDAHEPNGTVAALALKLGVSGSALLLDDVSLERVDGEAGNTTAFRDEVVDALAAYRPGVLRYMASEGELGSTVENLEATQFARERSGYSAWQTGQQDVTYGLEDFLQLCAKVKADPWITLPAASSAAEAAQMVEWLQQRGWTRNFSRIHVELGNETWNGIFYGETFDSPTMYGHRASMVFNAMRRAQGFDAGKFDLVVGGFVTLPDRNAELVANLTGADTLAVAPYLMHSVDDVHGEDALFGPLFAEPQQMEQAGGLMARNAAVAMGARAKPLHLAVYEVNLHTTEGNISEDSLNKLLPSLGAGLAMAEHTLLMLRDEGVTTQAMYSLPGYENKRSDGKQIKLWGTVVDMGASNRRRPQFLAMQMVNAVIGDELVETQVSGAHEIEGFAFAGGGRHGVVLLNLSLSAQRRIELDGANAPHGMAHVQVLNAASVEANNEDGNGVAVQSGQMDFGRSDRVVLPPHSMMTLSW